jgi:Na+/melibiose symporter-like transporter
LIFAPIIAFVRPFTCGFITETPMLEGEDDSDEEREEGSKVNRKDMSYMDSIREFLSIWWSAICFRDFSLLSLCWFLANAVVNLVQSNIVLYTKYYLDATGWGKLVVTFLQLGIALSLPLWGLIIKKIGKKKSLLIGCTLLCFLFIGCFFLPQGLLSV